MKSRKLTCLSVLLMAGFGAVPAVDAAATTPTSRYVVTMSTPAATMSLGNSLKVTGSVSGAGATKVTLYQLSGTRWVAWRSAGLVRGRYTVYYKPVSAGRHIIRVISPPTTRHRAGGSPSKTISVHQLHPLPTPVAITTTSIGVVKLGTLAGEAERRLRALLGRPDRVLDGGCTLSTPKEHARYLTWGSLTATLSDQAPGSVNTVVAKALYSWQVGEGRSPAELTLPHGVKVGMSSIAVRTRATITRTITDLSGDVLLIGKDGIEYDFVGVKEPTTLGSISYHVYGCE